MFGSGKKASLEKLAAQWGKTKDTSPNIYQVARYHARKEPDPNGHTLSERTISALDFPELFAYLDRTVSRVGQQYLFNRLASYKPHEDVEDSERIIEHAAAHEQDRFEAQRLLSRLQHENAYGICALFFDAHPKPPELLPLIKLQVIFTVILVFVTIAMPQLFVPLMVIMGINTLVHYYYKGLIQQFTFAMDQLTILTGTVADLSKLSFTNRKGKDLLPALKSIREVTNTWTMLGNTAGGGFDATDLAWLAREYVKMIFLIEPVMFFSVIKKLSDKRDDVRALFEHVGFVDTCISILSVRQSSVYCVPKRTAVSKGFINAEEMFHPLIRNCQANSWSVNDRSLLITGSNMSGKSAFIRTVAVNVLCAHTINTCFARSFTTSFFKIHAIMNIADDLLDGKSYYMEEVLSIRNMVINSSKQTECLFLLDEIFRGTNTTERIAAARGVLGYLNKKNTAIAATHDADLTHLLSDTFDMYHFCEQVDQDGVSFDYILKKGKLKHGNAIRILELNGYPAEIVEVAREIAAGKE